MVAPLVLEATADTHGHFPQTRGGDVLIHVGDWSRSRRGSEEENSEFLSWMRAQPHQYKLLVAGNHDCTEGLGQLAADHGVTLLENSGVYLEGKLFFGFPYVPHDERKDISEQIGRPFVRERGSEDMLRLVGAIPEHTACLLSHCPPQGMLDGPKGLGCPALRQRLAALGQLGACIFGHIHEGAGWVYQERDAKNGGCLYANVAYSSTRSTRLFLMERKVT